MPTYRVINRKTRVMMGEVVSETPDGVLAALADQTDSSIEEIAHSLGKTVDDAKAALDIVEVGPAEPPARKGVKVRGKALDHLPRRALYA